MCKRYFQNLRSLKPVTASLTCCLKRPVWARLSLRRLLSKYLLMVLPIMLTPPFTHAAPEVEFEYKLKAALIYKLAKFVQWPETVFSDDAQPLGICVAGEDPFGTALSALESKKVQGRNITILSINAENVPSSCQVLFIGKADQATEDAILKTMRHRPVLTLSDKKSFAKRGGIIELANQQNRIGFVVNFDSAQYAGLTIAAPLLELSTVIKGD